MPRTSVLMPTHNRADVVGYAIRSVLAQTDGDFELLIVGDGCTDGTADVVTGFGDERIRWFDLPKAPHFGYANRNIALKQARGAFIAFAAHDDLLFPDHLELLMRTIEETQADWLYSRPLWLSADGIMVPFGPNLDNRDERETFLTKFNTIPASCVLHRTACFKRSGYWPEDVTKGADWHLWRRIIQDSNEHTPAYLKTPTCLHFSADWKRSRHGRSRQVKAMLEIMDAGDWVPSSMRYAIPEGTPEQAVAWAAMEAGGAEWVAQVRLDIATVLDRIALEAVQTLRFDMDQQKLKIERLEAILASEREDNLQKLRQVRLQRAALQERLEGELEAAKAEIARLEAELDAVRKAPADEA